MREIFFAPTAPTPNGPLHLGHAAGPYLTSDFLRRSAERREARCVTLCGSDVFESYVLLAAKQRHRTPEQICRENSERIKDDLSLLDVKIDHYLFPLEGEEHDRLTEVNHRVYRAYRDSGMLTHQTERLPYSTSHQMFALGCWMNGTCPCCGAPAGCFGCEECYSQYRPEELRNPSCRLENAQLEWRDAKTLAFRLPSLDWLDAAVLSNRVPEPYADVVKRSIRSNGLRVRLSIPGTWGISLLPETGFPGQVYHSSTALLPYALLSGEIAASLLGRSGNVFDLDSGVTTVRLLGGDGAVHHIAGSLGGAQLLNFAKPFDYMIINSFYLLSGQKFSTSRKHAVWVRQAICDLGIPSDVVRWYVARTSPMRGRTNFDPGQFADFVDRVLCQRVSSKLMQAIDVLGCGEPETIYETFRKKLEDILLRQDASLSLEAPDPQLAAMEIEDWCSTEIPADDRTWAYWWLKGLSLIAYPIMPRFGQHLWWALGHQGEPSKGQMYATPQRQGFGPCPNFSPLTPRQISHMQHSCDDPL